VGCHAQFSFGDRGKLGTVEGGFFCLDFTH
jgi:hypothetical protein